jgi:YbgC/YbaW family acyl-CoA thioester hydrolase
MTPFVTRKRVEFCDTDMAGMMHFSNFFRFMEFAEQEYRRSLGLSVNWVEGAGHYGFPRVSANCDYLQPARFEQVLEIEVRVERLGTKSVTFGFTFRHEGRPVARGAMTSVCCLVGTGGAIESVPIPDHIRQLLGPAPGST